VHGDRFDQEVADSYFGRVAEPLPKDPAVRSVVVTHLLADRQPFLDGVSRVSPIALLLPKPKSLDPGAKARLDPKIRVEELRRSALHEEGFAAKLIADCGGGPFVVLDVGGYFAPLLYELHGTFGNEFVGVVEDTENGLQKYEALGDWPVPVVSVARSPLKNAEDYLVGQSIVFSVEAILRERSAIFQGRRATVIGYGKVGRSIASLLFSRGVSTRVYDVDPIRMTEAMSHGFEVPATLEDALDLADLVLCATGNLSLTGDDFRLIRRGAYIATVTSSDDELDLHALRASYHEEPLSNHFTRFSSQDHYFYLLNKGNAVNFLHGAAVGPFINLVQGEIIVAVREICGARFGPGLGELGQGDRRSIAKVWLDHYGSWVR
jgi:adenosylhomocysteinase